MIFKKILQQAALDGKVADLDITGISEDTRRAACGDAFFVKPGSKFDIFGALKDIDGKVSVVIADKRDKQEVQTNLKKTPAVFVDDIQEVFCQAADRFYDFSPNALNWIGVTGTNGKTTTTYLLYHLLNSLGKGASLIGTVRYCVGKNVFDATHTTPSYLSLRQMARQTLDINAEYIVMEASSHGIDQDRIRGLKFSACLFTNLTRDHLDYHKTMANYFEAKKKLFTKNPGAFAVINRDDAWGRKILKAAAKPVSYGINPGADFQAKNIKLGKDGTVFDVVRGKDKARVETQLVGKHNVYNILAALATLDSLGFDLGKAARQLAAIPGVEGRLQRVAKDVFVDYAHTPDALEKIIKTLNEVGYKNVISLFGCGGDRDKGKRKIMGRISDELAAFSIVTSDNPRTEDAVDICRQIEAGFLKKNHTMIVDRKEAIAKGLAMIKKYKHSCLLLAGKGHEAYQIIGATKFRFKDADVARELISRQR